MKTKTGLLKSLALPEAAGVKRLYQQVAEALLDDIAGGAYRPGDRLPGERELASRLGGSRPTVREAIIALEIGGVVDVRNGSGVYVKNPTVSHPLALELDIGPFELMEARALFEGEAAALAARCIKDEEVEALKEAIDAMVEENKQPRHRETADRRFHLLIAEATRNSAVRKVVFDLWEVREASALTARMLDEVRKNGWKPRIAEHRAIFDAISARDPNAARKAMRDHMARVIDQLLTSTEVEAISEAKRKISENRQRFTENLELQ
ncbi:MAG: FadR/GntR family transcriptional regulator [Parvularculaceae bacterium]